MQFSVIYASVGNLTSSLATNFDKQITNEAYQDILQRRRWSFLASTTSVALVASQRTYKVLGTSPVVTDFDAPISVTLEVTASGARVKLPRVDPQLFEDLTGHSFVNGVPMMWTVQGDTAATTPAAVVQGGQQSIVVAPPPTASAGQGVNLLIRYWRNAASIEMSADTDIPILPTAYHHMIITRACSMALTRNLQRADAAGFEQDFQSQLSAAIDADQSMYAGDNDTVVLKPVIQTPSQAPLTQGDFNRSTRPLPAGV